MPPEDPTLDLELCRETIAEDDAEILDQSDVTSSSLLGDREIQRGWRELGPDTLPNCEKYLDLYTSAKNTNPSKFVDDPKANGETYPGRWRQAFLRRTVRGDVSSLVQVLRLGYITKLVDGTTLDWSEARVDDIRDLPGDGGDNNPNSYILAKFQNVSPVDVEDIVASINGLTTNTFEPEIKGKAYGTGFTRLHTTHRIEADGSATIFLLVGKPQFDLDGFRDLGGTEETTLNYLHNVPQSVAQGLMDAHKTGTGKAATVHGYDDVRGLVNLILSEKVGVLENLTITDIPIACDTTETHHYAWGYDEDATETFIDAHDGALGAGETRRIRIQTRGDGLKDIVIIETTVTYDVAKHKMSISLTSGDVTTDAREWGWNISLTQLNTIKTPWETATVNVRNTFRVTRKDDCTFDYEASAVTETKRTSTFESTGAEGVNVTVTAVTNDASAPVALTSAKRTQHRLNTELNDLGSHNYTSETRVVQQVTGVIGTERKVYYGSNADDPPTLGTEEKLVSASISGNDDGTINYVVTTKDPEDIAVLKTYEAGGVKIELGSQADAANIPDAIDAGRRVDSASISVDEDGLANFSVRSTDITARGPAEISDGKRKARVYRNQSSAPSLGTGEKLVNASLDIQPDGRIDANLLVKDTNSPETVTTSHGTQGEAITDEIAEGVAPSSVPTPGAGGQGTEEDMVVSINEDDGTASYRRRTTTQSKVSAPVMTSGTATETEVTDSALNDTASPATSPPSAGQRVEVESVIKQNGLIDWIKRVVTRTQREWFSSDYRNRTRTDVTRRTAATAAEPTGGTAGKVVQVTNELQSDNTYDVERVEVTPVTVSTTAIEIFNDGIVKKELELFFNQEVAPTGGSGIEILNLEYNDFGMYDYRKVTTTILVSSQIIETQNIVQIVDSPVKAGFNLAGTRMIIWLLKYTRTVNQALTRTYSLTPAVSSSNSPTETLNYIERVGYDTQRGVWFVDRTVTTTGAWGGHVATQLEPQVVP